VEPEKKPLLRNGSETTFISRQRLRKHVPFATDTHATTEVLLETMFSARSVQRSYKEENLGNSQLCTEVCEEKRQLEGSRNSERTGRVKLENLHC
jgi:hypothetical protein